MDLFYYLNHESFNEFLLVFSAVVCLTIGFFVFLHNKSKSENRLFFVMCILFCFWSLFGYLTFFAESSSEAIFWSRFAYSVTSVFLVVFYLFFLLFFKEVKKFNFFNFIVTLVCLFFVYLSSFTNSIVRDVEIKDVGVEPVFGWGAYLFYVYAFFVFVFILLRFYKVYVISDKNKKKKIEHFFMGTFIFLFLNIVFNIIIPIFLGSYKLHQLGNYAAIFFLCFTAYAIVKNELFGIKVILTQLVVGIVSVLLFVNIFFSEEKFEYVWNTGLFVIFLFFGFFLIRSVFRRLKAKEDIQKYSKKLQGANERLQELDQQKTEFISFAAHQLRSPLTSVKGFASLILEGSFGKIPPRIENAVKNIFDSAGVMIRSVEDFLNITRMEQGRMDYDIDTFDLSQVAQAVINELQPSAYEKKLDLSVVFKKNQAFEVKADESKTRHVIMNLVDNAIKYTKEGYVKVHLENTKNNKMVRLSVSDSGIGMSQEDIKKLFKKYSRSQNANDIQGVGLGLFIAKKIVEAQNGKIWAESPGEGQGSTFYLELPPGE